MGTVVEIDEPGFRSVLSSWPSGVVVLTTKHDHLVYGLTVSSFSSLSLDPKLVLACVANTNVLLTMLHESKAFAISVLATSQVEVADYFARSGREPSAKLGDEIPTFTAVTGSPIIDGAVAYLDCELHDLVPGGDHTIVLGKVVTGAHDAERDPLVYGRRAYHRLTPATS